MKATLAGHPLHPQLIALPVALFPTSLLMDILSFLSRKKRKSYRDAAYYTMVNGYLGGMFAAGSGLVDYFAIPGGTHTKKTANAHLLLNVAALNLFGISLLMRRKAEDHRASFPAFLLSAMANGIVAVSAWFGGDLVYRHGVRVKGVSPIEQARDLKAPADYILERFFHRMGEYAPGQVNEDSQENTRVQGLA